MLLTLQANRSCSRHEAPLEREKSEEVTVLYVRLPTPDTPPEASRSGGR